MKRDDKPHEPRKCECCGAVFTPQYSFQVFCSTKCQRRKNKRNERARRYPKAPKSRKTAAYLPDVAGRLASLDEIQLATKRPRNVSPLRWRIELRRRANAEYYKMLAG